MVYIKYLRSNRNFITAVGIFLLLLIIAGIAVGTIFVLRSSNEICQSNQQSKQTNSNETSEHVIIYYNTLIISNEASEHVFIYNILTVYIVRSCIHFFLIRYNRYKVASNTSQMEISFVRKRFSDFRLENINTVTSVKSFPLSATVDLPLPCLEKSNRKSDFCITTKRIFCQLRIKFSTPSSLATK